MDKISCDIINDLLPLYCDEVCSQDSRRLIETHLKNCSGCRRLLETMQNKRLDECMDKGFEQSPEQDFYQSSYQNFNEYSIFHNQEQHGQAIMKGIAARWKKSVWKSFLKGLFTAICIFALLLSGWLGLTRWPAVIVPAEFIKADVTESSQRITIHIEVTDANKVLFSEQSLTEDGKLFLVEKRGILPVKNGGGMNFETTYHLPKVSVTDQGTNAQVKEIYYGTKENPILLWKD